MNQRVTEMRHDDETGPKDFFGKVLITP